MTPGTTSEQAFDGPAGHAWRVRVPAGTYVDVTVEPRDVDVALRLSGPDGRTRLQLDRAVGEAGREDAALLADPPGDYVVEVLPRLRRTEGHYTLRVGAARPALPDDRRRAEALALEARADAEHRAARPGALARACQACDAALERWRTLPAPADTALALRHCARLRTLHGEFGAARELLEAALPLDTPTADARGRAQAQAELADVHCRLWRFERAAEQAAAALAGAHRSGDRWAQALARHVQGDRVAHLGDPERAVAHYREALELWRAVGDRRGEATTLTSWGDAYTLLGRSDEARDRFHQALELRRADGDSGGQAEDTTYLGWLAYLDNDYDTALHHYAEALPVLERLGQNADLAGVLDRRGSAWLRLDRYDDALADYGRALPLVRASGERPGEARVLSNIAAVHTQRREWEPARHAYAEARQLLQGTDDVEALTGVLLGSATLNRKRREPDEALRDVEQIVTLFERLRRQVGVQVSRASYLAARHKFFELQVELLMELDAAHPGAGYDVRAFEAAEGARARTLLDSLAWSRGGSGTEPRRDPQLRHRIEEADQRVRELREAKAPAAEQAQAEQHVDDLLAEQDAEELEQRGPDAPGLSPASLAEVQRELLDDGTLLLAYALGQERSFLWLVSREHFETHVLPPRARIEGLARTVHERLQHSRSRTARPQALLAAAQLSDLILAPVLERLGTLRLVIAADGALQYVPFAALPVPPRQAPRADTASTWPDGRVPLVAEHEVVHAPSASVLLELRRTRARRTPPRHTIAVLADPVFELADRRLRDTPAGVAAARTATGGDPPARELRRARASARDAGQARLERLVYSGPEADTIGSLVAPDQYLDVRGFDATRDLVLGDRLRDYRILHFATHGVLNERHPQLSGLVLTLYDRQGRPLNGFLRVSDLARVELPADLVVLSACRTALGQDLRGEGLFGLTQGFLQAGARRVVVSLWSVDDFATAALMQHFYRHLFGREPSPPAAALRAAQLDLLALPELAAPEYWAGFTLQGDWQ